MLHFLAKCTSAFGLCAVSRKRCLQEEQPRRAASRANQGDVRGSGRTAEWAEEGGRVLAQVAMFNRCSQTPMVMASNLLLCEPQLKDVISLF